MTLDSFDCDICQLRFWVMTGSDFLFLMCPCCGRERPVSSAGGAVIAEFAPLPLPVWGEDTGRGPSARKASPARNLPPPRKSPRSASIPKSLALILGGKL
jgi:hypothetical protein